MKTLYLRIYLTLVGVLLAFALGAGWLAHREVEQERSRFDQVQLERLQGVAELLGQSLPPPDAPRLEQQRSLLRWGQQLRMPLALEDRDGQRIAAHARFERREERGDEALRVALPDGRTLLLMGPSRTALREAAGPVPSWLPPWLPRGLPALGLLFLALFVGVALGAWPVVRRLTRRLEALRAGVERFGHGELQHRVSLEGRDEVAQVAQTFNATADRVTELLRAHQDLLANASHELRSPLARLKLALQMQSQDPTAAQGLQAEVQRNLAELDQLVEEILMASRLEARAPLVLQAVDLLALAAEECARAELPFEADPALAAAGLSVQGDERLLRRALRNLLENARRYGGHAQSVALGWGPGQRSAELHVLDRGVGVPADLRGRIFEPFFRLPGHAEVAGGVGLGLALVRQIALAHGGRVGVADRAGGGSDFVLSLPLRRAARDDAARGATASP